MFTFHGHRRGADMEYGGIVSQRSCPCKRFVETLTLHGAKILITTDAEEEKVPENLKLAARRKRSFEFFAVTRFASPR